MKLIGSVIRQARLELGLSIGQLATAARCTARTVENVEHERQTNTNPSTIEKLLDVLGLDEQHAVYPNSGSLHGHDAGYRRHRRLGQTPCHSCTAAHADTVRRNRRNRGADS